METMAVLSLPPRSMPDHEHESMAYSIDALLRHRGAEEIISDLECDVCHLRGQVGQSSYRFWTKSDIVIFRINRYAYDEGGNQIKRHDRICPEMKLPLDTGEYHLVAALEHRGNSQQSGHYQTVVLTAHGWQRRNDGMLEEQCAYDAVPRLNEQDIYLLVYARPNVLADRMVRTQ